MTAVADEQARRWALDRAVNRLREQDPLRSAAVSVAGWQRTVLWVLLIGAVGTAIWQPLRTTIVLIAICTLAYVLTMVDRVLIFRQGLAYRAIVVSDEQARGIPDADLPRYTILVPAYNEPEVVGDLLAAMSRLEYPADKVEILLLLEEDDAATIAAAAGYRDAPSVRIVLVPPGEPRTKPKACNYGLQFATGAIVTIYDAEDIPEPLQLRRVVAAFAGSPREVV